MRIGSRATAASNRVDGYLPTEVLRAARWKTMSLRKLEPKQLKVRVFRPKSLRAEANRHARASTWRDDLRTYCLPFLRE